VLLQLSDFSLVFLTRPRVSLIVISILPLVKCQTGAPTDSIEFVWFRFLRAAMLVILLLLHIPSACHIVLPSDPRPELTFAVQIARVKRRIRQLTKDQVWRVLKLQGEAEVAALVDWDGATEGYRGQRHWHVQVVKPLVELAQADDLLHRQEGEDEVIDTRLGNALGQVDSVTVYTDVGGRDGCRGDY